MRRISLPAVGSAIFMIVAMALALLGDERQEYVIALVFGLCSISTALLALRDR